MSTFPSCTMGKDGTGRRNRGSRDNPENAVEAYAYQLHDQAVNLRSMAIARDPSAVLNALAAIEATAESLRIRIANGDPIL